MEPKVQSLELCIRADKRRSLIAMRFGTVLIGNATDRWDRLYVHTPRTVWPNRLAYETWRVRARHAGGVAETLDRRSSAYRFRAL